MLYSLMHGNFVAAAQFNALGLIAVVMSVWTFVAWTYGRAVNRRVVSWQHHQWSAAIALVAVGIWFVIRNVPIAPFTSLHV